MSHYREETVMGEIVSTILKGKKLLTTLSIFTVAVAAAGVCMLAKPDVAAAATCPQDQYPETNILYCGLSSGTDAAQAISSFQSQYNANSDGHGHTDIQTAYNDTGASSAMVKGMNTGNTMIGTAYGNTNDSKAGTVVVNGRTVATDIWIGARWTQGTSGYRHIEGDVYTRSYKTYFLPNSNQVSVLVHFDSNGQADFIAMTPCGNMITFTPTPPPVKKLSCSFLTPSKVGSNDTTVSYTFTVKASATNTTPSSYTINFGDNNTQTINSTALQVTSNSHTYTLQTVSKTVTITAVVNGGGTSGNCSTSITLPPTPSKPQSLACVNITPNLQSGTTDTYTFGALAQPNNTTISSFTFNFGDGTNQTVSTAASTATSQAHKYAAGDYTAQVSVTGPLGTFTADACKTPIHIGSTPPVTPPTTLVNTGPGGIIGTISVLSVLGGLGYYFFIRRKLAVQA